SSPQRQAVDFVEQRLSGVGLLDISVQGNQRDAFKNPENLRVLENLETHVAGILGVDTTTSLNHFMKDMHKSFHDEKPEYYEIPDSRQLISQYLLLYDADDIQDVVNTDFDHARIMARLGVHSSSEQSRVIAAAKSSIDQLDTAGLSIRVTGQAVQDVNIVRALVSGQIYSLGIAGVVISLLMFIVFKSLSLGFLSLLPNIFPILLNFGIMGLLGIPLNTATSLIAAVAIGIAVDDTIHFLFFYNAKRKQGISAVEAVKSTVLIKGRALVSTSVILCVAFGVLLLSSFVPIIYFGLLSALIMLTALLGDLVLLPAVLMFKSGSAGSGIEC
ncbi:MAG: efflux RND transporter permease subunit, partial [Desulfohalobiaceae bacterium]